MVNVLNIERAAGVRPELLDLLDQWKIHGTFDLTVAENGGYRYGAAAERVQDHYFRSGQSMARTLEETPHGRRCAVDCHPVGFDPHRSFEEQAPGMIDKFIEWGKFVELCGFKWGGRFGRFGRYGDMPHAEIRHWAALFTFPDGEPVEHLTPWKP